MLDEKTAETYFILLYIFKLYSICHISILPILVLQ